MFSDRINHYLKMSIMSLMLVLGAVQLFFIFQNFSTHWYWILFATIYTVIINDIFLHRIVSHKMFKIDTQSWTYKILTFLASTDQGFGTVKNVSMIHNLHHIHSDNGPEDIMNWRHHWYSTAIVSPIPLKYVKTKYHKEYIKRQRQKYKDVFEDKWTQICAKYENEMSLTYFAILFAVFPIFLFNVVFVGRILLSIMTGLAGIAGHIKNFPLSYRNYNTNDTTSNNMIFHLMFFGLFAGMLQNNHHAKPHAESPNPKWWEVDTSFPIVKCLKFAMQKQ